MKNIRNWHLLGIETGHVLRKERVVLGRIFWTFGSWKTLA